MPWPAFLKPAHAVINPARTAPPSARSDADAGQALPPVLPGWYAFGLRHVVRTRECLLLDVEAQATGTQLAASGDV